MAWPCITRACCINRFWSELDHTDIAVPLVFTKYSDVAEVQHVHPQRQPGDRSVVGHETAQPTEQDGSTAAAKQHATTAALGGEGASSWSVTRQDFRAWKTVRPERSCKPRDQYHPSEAPFNNETQYRKDYKPWPIPRKGDHPWIPKVGGSPTKGVHDSADTSAKEKIAAVEVEAETGVEKCEMEEKQQEKEVNEREKEGEKEQKDALDTEEKPLKKKSAEVEKEGEKEEKKPQREEGNAGDGKGKGRAAADARNRQIKQDRSGSSYRTEFKPYMDVKPVRPIRAKSQYKLTSSEQASLETSYSATYRGQQGAPLDNKQLERRRIRSLYSEPRSKVDRSTAASRGRRIQPNPPNTPHHHNTHPPRSSRQPKTAREPQLQRSKSATGGQQQHQQSSQTRKKSAITGLHGEPRDADADPPLDATPPVTSSDTPVTSSEPPVSKHSKEMINRLAEGKE